MKMSREYINTDKAPAAIGPYAQAVKTNGLVFTSGQIPIDPAAGGIVPGGIDAQAACALDNLREVLTAAGAGLEDVVKTTVFLKSMDDFPAVNAVYARYFAAPYPARSCVEVARLPKDVLVEIEAAAVIHE